jgi:hypothetical protein
MDRLPDIVTHNYDPNGAFLRNLCDLPEIEAERVLDRLRAMSGMPDRRRDTEPSQRYEKFIEVQVWDDGPIERILNEAVAMGPTALRKS